MLLPMKSALKINLGEALVGDFSGGLSLSMSCGVPSRVVLFGVTGAPNSVKTPFRLKNKPAPFRYLRPSLNLFCRPKPL